MNKDKIIENIIMFLFIIIPLTIFLVIYWNILESNATRCENNGGIVVRNEFGHYEKCIYGGVK